MSEMPFIFDRDLIRETKGFLDDDEGFCLYETARSAAALGPLLEVGSYCGKSAIYLGSAIKPLHQVLYSIDHHRGSEEHQIGEGFFDPELFDEKRAVSDTFPFFRETLKAADLEDTVIPIVTRSHVAARSWATPLSLVFIDGGHAYSTVLKDYECWARHIIKGGVLLFHDIYEDPALGGQAPYHVYQIALKSLLFREIKRVNSLAVLEKIG